jgi:hypothetical protein
MLFGGFVVMYEMTHEFCFIMAQNQELRILGKLKIFFLKVSGLLFVERMKSLHYKDWTMGWMTKN